MNLQNIKLLPLSGLGTKRTTYKPYFTEQNARECQPVIDQLIAHGAGQHLIPSANSGYSPATLHLRLIWARKWLAEHDDGNGVYRKFQATSIFSRADNGVIVRFTTLKITTEPIAQVTDLSWINDFRTWLEGAKEFDIYDSRERHQGRLELSEQDETTLVGLCASTGVELDCNRSAGYFKVMK